MSGRIYKDPLSGDVKAEKEPDYYKGTKDEEGHVTLKPMNYGRTEKED